MAKVKRPRVIRCNADGTDNPYGDYGKLIWRWPGSDKACRWVKPWNDWDYI